MPEAASFVGPTPAPSVLFVRTDLRPTPIEQSSPHCEANETNPASVGRQQETHGQVADAGSHASSGAPAKRRAYNRHYMRLWRERNRERYRAANRDYQRKRALRRKAQRESASQVAEPGKCWYRCGRAAVTTIERVNPETWETVSVPYCGFC